jgi:hypothetical protein
LHIHSGHDQYQRSFASFATFQHRHSVESVVSQQLDKCFERGKLVLVGHVGLLSRW